jgi:hypothetical protein
MIARGKVSLVQDSPDVYRSRRCDFIIICDKFTSRDFGLILTVYRYRLSESFKKLFHKEKSSPPPVPDKTSCET